MLGFRISLEFKCLVFKPSLLMVYLFEDNFSFCLVSIIGVIVIIVIIAQVNALIDTLDQI